MKKPDRRRIILIAGAVVIVIAIVFAFLPDPVPVDVATVTRGPLRVIVEEEGETRIEDRYVVTSPVAAFARRIDLEPGDVVTEGMVLVELEPPRAAILDPRVQAEANARAAAAAAAAENADVVLERAIADRDRIATLYEAGAVPRQQLDEASAQARRASAALDAARADLAAARAAARTGATSGQSVPSVLRAPASGRVLAVHRDSEGPVNPGEPLLDIGDTQAIEVRADVLSEDAVRIEPGTRVLIDDWGGDATLTAVVTRVEPQGITETSALGVEEQRVPILASITSPPEKWAGLGSGYRVLARFIIWEGGDVLQVPTSALFRSGDGWAVFVVDDGRAVLREVTIGQQAGLSAGIVEGVAEGETVVVHPPNDLVAGDRVTVAESPPGG